MQRRNFLQLAAATGLSLGLPIAARPARADDPVYSGPFYVLVNAGGAWDPRFLFDPTLDPLQNRRYTDVGRVGRISYADIPVDLDAFGLSSEYGYDEILLSNATFLERHGARLTVVNGVDMQTNNHDAGSRAIWSGQLAEGYPSLGALIAATKTPQSPMAFLSAGGYDTTNNLVPVTRVGSASDMRKLALPNVPDPSNAESRDLYHSGRTFERIQATQIERLQALLDKEYLPRARQSMGELTLARARVDDLKALVLPSELVELGGYQLGALQNNMRQAQIAVAAFQAGLASAVNLDLGGFDTHGNHDRDQPRRIAELLALVDFVIGQIEAAGLGDRTVFLVGSDFARGPFYNGEREYDGKDHWPIGSFLALGAGIAGDRVVGGTTDDQRARPIDPNTLEPADAGVYLTFEHIHHALRRLTGVEAVAADYPLRGEALPLFG